MQNKDYYKILGVSEKAGEDEIKRKYRELAHQYHPDRPGGDEKKFKEINEAYQTLSDKDKRAQYDMMRQYGFGSSARQRGPAFGGDFEGMGFEPFSGGFGFSGSLDDLLRDFFVGMGGGGIHFDTGRRTRTQARPTYRFTYQGPHGVNLHIDVENASDVTQKMKQAMDEFARKFFQDAK
ncbi:MAG: hypothetical protein COV41_00770 [Candidatus Brennerbacteria bacterium CG11_big_fil_rev_8_21_14_0_20_43_10]|uniref:J domain-containing protein n=3 Tax=Candidatus Brenneribacteriota TaxID=1817902 RepID=A0A2H9N515_9BACT|nr:MAG: hypothetical protein AUJ43_02475 [Parcubacteria group bacterium CG1_02_44_31]PIP50425.1 MAG: hypothetical protein COX12_01420 [Candidatus Brennerbacteria bacterium CG23_combo_of_CG06-09_8_20_14_all_44_41]PIR26790.1 MAG: hypothetical protein COV41_00770 [Candidatus Brennerbacteria bacterium CG11_big_fil_rev_8_21_14_0_20_43_10]PIX28996.1 MAG: hypothetical protein COZ64_01350 [Candidatus Brennerbacteria bacterium CG_4_8_14_3_um_filter_43_14]